MVAEVWSSFSVLHHEASSPEACLDLSIAEPRGLEPWRAGASVLDCPRPDRVGRKLASIIRDSHNPQTAHALRAGRVLVSPVRHQGFSIFSDKQQCDAQEPHLPLLHCVTDTGGA